MGRRPELVGGGLIRSLGGWDEVKKMKLSGQDRIKSDQRILGESDFVMDVLSESGERFSRKYRLKSRGYNFEKVAERVSSLFDLEKTTVVAFGGLHIKTILFLAGFVITTVLAIKRIRGAMVIGIIASSILTLAVSSIGAVAGWLSVPLITLPKELFALPSFEVFLKLDILSALSIGMILPILSLLIVDLFDSVGTFVGVAQKANLVDKNGVPLRIGRALMVDAFSTTISGFFGTSSGSVYVESATGIQEGGRTGLTAVISGLLFLPFMSIFY